jgi:hypothetical protein
LELDETYVRRSQITRGIRTKQPCVSQPTHLSNRIRLLRVSSQQRLACFYDNATRSNYCFQSGLSSSMTLTQHDRTAAWINDCLIGQPSVRTAEEAHRSGFRGFLILSCSSHGWRNSKFSTRLSFGSNSHARRRSAEGYYAGAPASVSRCGFRLPRATPARRNPWHDPPKIPHGRLPSAPYCHLGLGVATSHFEVARHGWAQKEKRNVPESR